MVAKSEITEIAVDRWCGAVMNGDFKGNPTHERGMPTCCLRARSSLTLFEGALFSLGAAASVFAVAIRSPDFNIQASGFLLLRRVGHGIRSAFSIAVEIDSDCQETTADPEFLAIEWKYLASKLVC